MILSGRAGWLLSAVALALYLPTAFHGVFADDEIYLAYSNTMVRELPWSEWYRFFLERANRWEYLPLRDLSYWLDFKLFGDEPGGFHLTNIVWYGLSAAAFAYALSSLLALPIDAGSLKRKDIVWVAVLIFLFHPAHVEAVAWIASRKDLMAATFGFLALGLFAGSLREDGSLSQLGLALLVMLAGGFSKSSAVVFPLLCSLMALVWPKSSLRWRVVYTALPLCMATIIVLVHMHQALLTEIRVVSDVGVWAILDRASRIAMSLLGIVGLPISLRLYYDPYQLSSIHWLFSLLLLAGVAAAVRSLLTRPALWAMGLLLTVLPWVVYLQGVPFSTWSLASERFVFVSVAGLGIVVVDVFGRLPFRGIAQGILAAYILCSALIVGARVSAWETAESLRGSNAVAVPDFHNTLRDRVLYGHLPGKQWDDAHKDTDKVQRPYAREALRQVVEVERHYRAVMNWRTDRAVLEDHSGFCAGVLKLRSALAVGFEAVRDEADVSYNNFLRSLARLLDVRYSDERVLCRSLGAPSTADPRF